MPGRQSCKARGTTFNYICSMESSNPSTNPDEFGKIEIALWDADNTIWDWVAYAAPAYEAMCASIATETGRGEDDVAAAMKSFYSSVGTMEHEGLIQGMESHGFFKNVKNFNREDLIIKAQKAFSVARKKNLHVFPGIQKVFKEFHDRGIKNGIITDAPEFQARMRLKHSRLTQYIDPELVFTMAKNEISNLPKVFQDKEKKGEYETGVKAKIVRVEKPYTDLEEILRRTREEIRSHVIIIGDNRSKDMQLAYRYGSRGIHVLYGQAKPELLQRLKKFAPEKVANRNIAIIETNGAAQNEKNIRNVNHPLQILKIAV